MKVKLSPNAELDLLTQEELDQSLTAAIERFLSGHNRRPGTIREPVAVELDASGNTAIGPKSPIGVPLYKVPAGYRFALHRLSIKADGFTFAAPFTNAAGFLELQRSGLMVDGLPLTSPGLPLVFTTGTADSIVYDNNQTVDLLISGGPASTAVQLVLQGTLSPIVLG